MAELISNQGEINKGFKLFNSSAAKFGVAAAGLSVVADKIWNSSSEFKDAVVQFGKVFTLATFTKSLEQVGKDFHSVRLEMVRQFGINGKVRRQYLDVLRDEERQTLSYGKVLQENMMTYIALSKELKDFRFLERRDYRGLISTSTQVAAAFQVTEESSANMVANLAIFQGKQADEITSFYSTILGTSQELGVSHRDVFENLTKSANSLYKFNLRSSDAAKNFAKMTVMTSALGIGMDSVVQTMDKTRTIGQAMETSAILSAQGINVDPMKIFASAQSSSKNPLFLYKQVFGGFLSKGFTSQGTISDIGIKIAGPLADQLNMSQDDFIKSATYYYKNNMDISSITEATLKEQAAANMGFADRLDMFTKSVTTKFLDPWARVMLPLMERVLDVLGFVARQINRLPPDITNGFAHVMTGILTVAMVAQMKWLFVGLGKIFGPIIGALGGKHVLAGLAASINPFNTAVGPGMEAAGSTARRGVGGIRDRIGMGARGVKGWFKSRFGGRGKGPATTGAQDIAGASRALPKPYTILAQSAMLVAFSASIWILSKAFQNFSDGVSWQGVLYGIGAMTAFSVAVIAVSSTMTAAAKPIALATILLGALAGSIWVLSKAFQNFASPFMTPTMDLSALNPSGIMQIGMAAKTYMDPISKLANALASIAESMTIIRVESNKGINLAGSQLAMATSGVISGGASAIGSVPIKNNIRIDIDGKRVGRAVVESMGG